MATIFYGIWDALEKNKRKIDRWISIAGKPDVFCEKDENLHKYQSRLFANEYEVVSLDEGIKRYPDADVWVTWPKVGSVTTNRLLTKFPVSKIHFLEADLEYRNGCGYLGHFISYRKDNFSPCCVTGRCPIVKTSGSVSERMAHWQEYTTKLVDDIRNQRPNDCEKCHLLKFGAWRKTVRLDWVSFGSNNPGDICTFDCIYCFSNKSLKRLKGEKEGLTTYEIIRQLSEMPEYDTENFTIQLSNGEFCANRHCNDMLDILLQNKWKVKLVSNFSVYREKLATLMETGRVISTLVSMDAGTGETFKKIKQRDMYDRVIENLKKYPIHKANLALKYIFLEGINDNEQDIDGFYDLVKEIGCKTIVLSTDQRLNFAPITNKMRELSLRIIIKAKRDGISISSNSSYLNQEDAKFINAAVKNPFVGKGKIIFLSGVSSSGKTTLAKELQEHSTECYWRLSQDDFLDMAPMKLRRKTPIEMRNQAAHNMIKHMKTLSDSGENVIIDTVLISKKNPYKDIIDSISQYPVCKVHVTCPLEEVIRRNEKRVDRKPGLSEKQMLKHDDKSTYDITVDTFNQTVEKCAEVILDYVSDNFQ